MFFRPELVVHTTYESLAGRGVGDQRVEVYVGRINRQSRVGEKVGERVARLFSSETLACSAEQQSAAGCWPAQRRRLTSRSVRDPRPDRASCRDRGTARRCVPRCRRGPFFEGRTLLVSLAFGSFRSTALWDGYYFDACLLARLNVVLAVKATIRAVQLGRMAEPFAVAPDLPSELPRSTRRRLASSRSAC